MAEETYVAEHDREAIDKLVTEAPCDPSDERLRLMLEIAYAMGRKTGYDEAVETAKKHMGTTHQVSTSGPGSNT